MRTWKSDFGMDLEHRTDATSSSRGRYRVRYTHLTPLTLRPAASQAGSPGGRVPSMHEKYIRRLLSDRLAGLAIGFAQMAADPSANLLTIRPAMTEPHRPGVVHRQHPARFS
jgi:hypothetical protein